MYMNTLTALHRVCFCVPYPNMKLSRLLLLLLLLLLLPAVGTSSRRENTANEFCHIVPCASILVDVLMLAWPHLRSSRVGSCGIWLYILKPLFAGAKQISPARQSCGHFFCFTCILHIFSSLWFVDTAFRPVSTRLFQRDRHPRLLFYITLRGYVGRRVGIECTRLTGDSMQCWLFLYIKSVIAPRQAAAPRLCVMFFSFYTERRTSA